MLPDNPLGLGMADAFDHRGVVERVREDHEAGDLGAEGAEDGPVRDIAGGEEKGRADPQARARAERGGGWCR